MSEKPDPRTRLIAETFSEDWASGPAGDIARRAAAHARFRRTARKALFAGIVSAAAMVAMIATSRFSSDSHVDPLAIATTNPSFEIISEEQLMVALGNRPLLILPDEPAGRRFVLLSQ